MKPSILSLSHIPNYDTKYIYISSSLRLKVATTGEKKNKRDASPLTSPHLPEAEGFFFPYMGR